MFSDSKIEGFGDVLVPSWFEWRGKIGYSEEEDLDWKAKKDNVGSLFYCQLSIVSLIICERV